MKKAREFPGFKDRLLARLGELGYTSPYRFCEAKGYMPNKVYRWTAGQTPTIDELRRLSLDLGVSMAWLLLGEESSDSGGGRQSRKVIAGGSDGSSPQSVERKSGPRLLGVGGRKLKGRRNDEDNFCPRSTINELAPSLAAHVRTSFTTLAPRITGVPRSPR